MQHFAILDNFTYKLDFDSGKLMIKQVSGDELRERVAKVRNSSVKQKPSKQRIIDFWTEENIQIYDSYYKKYT